MQRFFLQMFYEFFMIIILLSFLGLKSNNKTRNLQISNNNKQEKFEFSYPANDS